MFVLPSWFLLTQVQLVMVDDDATPLNPPVAPVQQEELDLNVSQRPREKEPPRSVATLALARDQDKGVTSVRAYK